MRKQDARQVMVFSETFKIDFLLQSIWDLIVQKDLSKGWNWEVDLWFWIYILAGIHLVEAKNC